MIEIKKIARKIGGFSLKEVTFNINDGDVVAFVGDNGAGKTTTIKALFGELKIDSGEILIDGESIFANNNLRRVAFFPDSNNVPLNMKLSDYLKYICAANDLSKEETELNTEFVYRLLELKPYKDKLIKKLSSGWKKKAIMASVLIRKPKYIIFDEPTANVDVESKLYFMDIFRLLAKVGITILITSHIIEELQEVANHLVLIKKGTIVHDELFDNKKEKIMDVYKKHMNSPIKDLSILNKLYSSKRKEN
ncbi:ATP-binding cassette domain-containing protein [Spiroplasma turonicum]|uniref:ABC transporter ATP-binding protein n=1 Tax=Spiroplasma turonicum TaxID=216946 RepID=A0A0K1P5A0_9MOLU|nr:ABC transporter ATP-binding protein [Spiroplasma turonicum]AKU79344.1 ABC transporter ATP-binding protein [Spiroplasma turonicum]ALX70365.1 ABC transporter ATP-binding protein [Spiroplasma turonicum]